MTFPRGSRNAIPVRNEESSLCNLSIYPLKNHLMLKMVEMKTHAGENPHCNKQKINESNGNLIRFYKETFLSNYIFALLRL